MAQLEHLRCDDAAQRRDPGGFGQATSAPYQISLTVPAARPGPFYITAGASIGPSNIVYSDPIPLDIERPDDPGSISVQEQALTFDKLGESQPLLVWGMYADGTTENITHSPGTTFAVVAPYPPAPVTVLPEGVVAAVAVGSGRIIVNGTYSVPVTVNPPIAVLPKQWQLYPGQMQQFFARVTPSLHLGTAVTWSLSPAVGYVDATGLYTAPDIFDSNNIYTTITATSVMDPTQIGQGYMTILPPLIALTPSPVIFGDQPLLTASSALMVTAGNTQQNQVATFSGITITGANPGDFTQSATTCGATLAPMASCTVSIQFTPQAQGPRAAWLTIKDDTGNHAVVLTGQGVTARLAIVTPVISVANKVYDGTTVAVLNSQTLTGINGTDNVILNVRFVSSGIERQATEPR